MLRRCRLVVGIHPNPAIEQESLGATKIGTPNFVCLRCWCLPGKGGRTAAHSEVGEPFSHFDRLCGGGQTDLIEGLRQLLQHADTSNHSDANLISGMEHLIATG